MGARGAECASLGVSVERVLKRSVSSLVFSVISAFEITLLRIRVNKVNITRASTSLFYIGEVFLSFVGIGIAQSLYHSWEYSVVRMIQILDSLRLELVMKCAKFRGDTKAVMRSVEEGVAEVGRWKKNVEACVQRDEMCSTNKMPPCVLRREAWPAPEIDPCDATDLDLFRHVRDCSLAFDTNDWYGIVRVASFGRSLKGHGWRWFLHWRISMQSWAMVDNYEALVLMFLLEFGGRNPYGGFSRQFYALKKRADENVRQYRWRLEELGALIQAKDADMDWVFYDGLSRGEQTFLHMCRDMGDHTSYQEAAVKLQDHESWEAAAGGGVRGPGGVPDGGCVRGGGVRGPGGVPDGGRVRGDGGVVAGVVQQGAAGGGSSLGSGVLAAVERRGAAGGGSSLGLSLIHI